MKNKDQNWFLVKPRKVPVLDPDFRPAVLANQRFREEALRSGKSEPLTIAVEADNGLVSGLPMVKLPLMIVTSGPLALRKTRLLVTAI